MVVMAALLILPTDAYAQNWFERLVMPGELIEGHAKLESKCANCHSSFSKKGQRPLCLDCHKEINKDIQSKTGFHGRSKEVGARECSHCHTDHIGRKADTVNLDEETFNHNRTDFPLVGRHQRLGCNQCHKSGQKPRQASNTCLDCHKKDEPHKGQLGTDCATCHNAKSWTDTSPFDHSKTDFPLKDAHQKVACQTCHIGEIYKDLPSKCVDCHQIQDVHAGRFGPKCETCHRSTKWTEVRFNHDQDTKFPLIGKHEKVKCNACHKTPLYGEKTSTQCSDCHGVNDPHKGQLGKQCDACHSPKGWRDNVVFEHDITRFPLIGLHALVPCEACHISAAFKEAPLACSKCHSRDDYHKGKLGLACATCHNPNGWQRWVFNHNRQTKYPLTGSHDGLECRACHTKARKASRRITTQCVDCHGRDDVHKGQFGRQCQTCHITENFKRVRLRKKN